MSRDYSRKIIKTAVSAILQLLSDSESSDSDEESEMEQEDNSTTDLSLALLGQISVDANPVNDNLILEEIVFEDDSEPVMADHEPVTEEVDLGETLQNITEPTIPAAHQHGSVSEFFVYPYNYNSIDFRCHFKMSRSTIELLVTMIPDKPEVGRPAINNLTFVLVSVWYLVSQEPHNGIAERFKLGKAHTHRICVDFFKIFGSLGPDFITWPDSQEADETVDTFKKSYGFPGVVGILGNTHFTIKCPAFDALNYTNSYGKYSVYLQAVVLPDLRFSFVFAGWPGSATDAEVWHKSPLYPKLRNNPATWLLEDCHLLSEGAFPLETFLLTPYSDPGLSKVKQHYNQKHRDTCVVFSYTIGLLKSRFDRFNRFEIQKMDMLPNLIVTACVLHNICLELKDGYENAVLEDVQESIYEFDMPSREAEMKRDAVANAF